MSHRRLQMRLDRCHLGGVAPAGRKTEPPGAGMAMAFSSRRVHEGRVLALEVVGRSSVLNPLKLLSPYSTLRSDRRRGLFALFSVVVIFVVVFAFLVTVKGKKWSKCKATLHQKVGLNFILSRVSPM